MTADNDNTEILLIFFGGEYVMKVRQVTVIERGLPCTHLDVGHSQILRWEYDETCVYNFF